MASVACHGGSLPGPIDRKPEIDVPIWSSDEAAVELLVECVGDEGFDVGDVERGRFDRGDGRELPCG